MRVNRLIKPTNTRFLCLAAGAVLSLVTSEVHANPTTQAPEDDILEVVDLPLAVDLAKGSGLSETELQESVDVARDGGMGAAVLSEVLVAESDAVKIRGKKKGLPDWLMTRWAAGVRGVDLTGEVKARPEQAKLDATEKNALKETIKRQRTQRLKARKARRNAIKEQRKAGKPVRLRGKSAHVRLKHGKPKGHGEEIAEQAKKAGPNNEVAHQEAKPSKDAHAHEHKAGAKGHGKAAKQAKHHAKAHPKRSKHSAGRGKAKGKSNAKSGKKGRGKHK